MKKVGMIGIISNPVTSLNSHNGGWTYTCKKILDNIFTTDLDILTEKDDWNKYDTLIINEGVNYKEGVYNFFGGVQDKTIIKLKKLLNYNGQLYCINDNIDYNHMCSKRKELNDFKAYNFDLPGIINTSQVSKFLILGDSHSISLMKKGYSISRNDGKTLYGFLKEPDIYYNKSKIDKLITYFGNIDVRFHLGRQLNPEKATKDLVNKYVNWCWDSGAKPTCLLPIETEDRKIPGTGLYNGQPFYGSRELRRELVDIFNSTLKAHFLDCLTWPEHWYKEDYDFTKEMESRQSVHLRPSSYMFSNELIKKEQPTLF